MSLFHAIYASTVFVVAYVLIATERFNKTLVALAGATAMFFLPLINSDEVFYSRDTGDQLGRPLSAPRHDDHRQRGPPDRRVRICRDLVGQTRQGLPAADHDPADDRHRPRNGRLGQRHHGVADRTGHPAGVRPARVNPAPFLIVEALTANIAGAATLVGDPTSIIIGTGAHLSFIEFTANMAPAVLLVLVAFVALLPRLFPGFFVADPERVADVMALDEREAIRDRGCCSNAGSCSLAVFAGSSASGDPHGAVAGGDGRRRDPDPDLRPGARVLPGQRRMGNTAVLRGTVRHGRCPGADRRHQQLGPTSQPPSPRRLRGRRRC